MVLHKVTIRVIIRHKLVGTLSRCVGTKCQNNKENYVSLAWPHFGAKLTIQWFKIDLQCKVRSYLLHWAFMKWILIKIHLRWDFLEVLSNTVWEQKEENADAQRNLHIVSHKKPFSASLDKSEGYGEQAKAFKRPSFPFVLSLNYF